jgi:hypothetical protein
MKTNQHSLLGLVSLLAIATASAQDTPASRNAGPGRATTAVQNAQSTTTGAANTSSQQPEIQSLFRQLDANGDGSVSNQEFTRGSQLLGFDANGNRLRPNTNPLEGPITDSVANGASNLGTKTGSVTGSANPPQGATGSGAGAGAAGTGATGAGTTGTTRAGGTGTGGTDARR